MQVNDYLRLIIIIVIMVTIKTARINFHLTSGLLLPYISVINANAERLKAKLRAESTQAKHSFSVTKKPKIVDDKVDKRVTELKEHDKKNSW